MTEEKMIELSGGCPDALVKVITYENKTNPGFIQDLFQFYGVETCSQLAISMINHNKEV